METQAEKNHTLQLTLAHCLGWQRYDDTALSSALWSGLNSYSCLYLYSDRFQSTQEGLFLTVLPTPQSAAGSICHTYHIQVFFLTGRDSIKATMKVNSLFCGKIWNFPFDSRSRQEVKLPGFFKKQNKTKSFFQPLGISAYCISYSGN